MNLSPLAAVARTWVGTPYVRGGMIKGVGCDCASLIYACLLECGLIGEEEIGLFSNDWWAHTTEETYMFRVMKHADRVLKTIAYQSSKIDSGQIVLVRAAGSRVYNHGGIVTLWPRCVHAIGPAVEEIDASTNPMWSMQQIAVFDPFVKDTNQ